MLILFKARYSDEVMCDYVERNIEVDDEDASTPAYAWMKAIMKAMEEVTETYKLDRLEIDFHDDIY